MSCLHTTPYKARRLQADHVVSRRRCPPEREVYIGHDDVAREESEHAGQEERRKVGLKRNDWVQLYSV